MKPIKVPSLVYADLEFEIKKIGRRKNIPKKSFTTKQGENILCGCSMSTLWRFSNTENKHNGYRSEDCIKNFKRA